MNTIRITLNSLNLSQFSLNPSQTPSLLYQILSIVPNWYQTPLYVALILGYGSVKWWRIFTADQCDAVNRLACYFTLPLFTFEFTSHADPLQMNYRFLAGDAISKILVLLALAVWCKWPRSTTTDRSNTERSTSDSFRYCWSITVFSLCAMTNTLVVGVPLMKAMFGQWAVDLVVQAAVAQCIVWFPVILFVMELRRSGGVLSERDLEGNNDVEGGGNFSSLWSSTARVLLKLVKNPNFYACVIGIFWAFLSNRFHLKMPDIVQGSVLVMSRAGTATAMFSMGLFMACQEKIISCGASLAVFGMVLKFIAGPATTVIAAFVVGLRGEILYVAVIQAALPQAIASFIFAKEYELHANVLSTAVIFGTLVSLPVLIAYYAVVQSLH